MEEDLDLLAALRIIGTKCPYLRSVNISVTEGTVILNGVTSSFYYKQQAQESIKRHAAGKLIRNELVVDLQRQNSKV